MRRQHMNPYSSMMPPYQQPYSGYSMPPINQYETPFPQYGMNNPYQNQPMNAPYMNGMQQSNPYYQQQGQFTMPYQNQGSNLFYNPLQPEDDYHYAQFGKQQNNMPNMYPKPPQAPKPPSNQFLQSFKSQDGSLDFNKMVNTAGSFMNAINQVSGMAKSIGGIFKA